MNITEKILARASKKSSVSPDDVIFADIDCAMVHDVSGPGVIKVFEKLEKQGIDIQTLGSRQDMGRRRSFRTIC